jgi:nicotinamide-nucleotide amidase
MKVEETLQGWFIKHKKKLAFAESCTGGSLAAHVTAIAGSSEYFLGSFVVYSNEMKENILGVSKQTLQTKGAVSVETVQLMAEGVFTRTSADFVIAVSGIAGPGGGTEETPVGTICAAIAERGKVADVITFTMSGSRQNVILTTTLYLLNSLLKKIEGTSTWK